MLFVYFHLYHTAFCQTQPKIRLAYRLKFVILLHFMPNWIQISLAKWDTAYSIRLHSLTWLKLFSPNLPPCAPLWLYLPGLLFPGPYLRSWLYINVYNSRQHAWRIMAHTTSQCSMVRVDDANLVCKNCSPVVYKVALGLIGSFFLNWPRLAQR